ncbi:D-glycerate dehydrogenase [Actinokineospora sp. UTMC 2448]|uniref:2-hydroxyacid dehydrogenase n=1 Tax=Actinokineospora sp. UTMC 2448 TaxID=2268449 RepID=UPI002164EDC2|nr:D-glycerate dehydrogenase [Actinokineospora sp. UTMC 2448]UVS77844.1 Glyoxylate/hydroxypyruvate reductase B [Actinokineospora sp. UTMC 2448]
MPDVLVTRRMVDAAMAALDGLGTVEVYTGPPTAMPRAELLTRVAGVRGLLTVLTERIDAELLDAAGPGLRIVANHAVGVDNIDIAECTRRGVLVTNTPDVLTEATADLAWALILACVRRVAEGDRFLRAKTPWIWDPRMMLGHDLHGRVLGIVGCGRIGQATARRALGFGMRVVYHNSRPLPPEVAEPLGATWRSFDDLLAESDVVSVHCPLTPDTRHLFGAEAFARMKSSAVLVNTSRGPVVDELALAQALRAGEIFAAGLDVFEREPEVEAELLDLDSVTLLPHLGSATVGTREAMGLLAVQNLAAGLAGARPRNLLNPEAFTG